MLFSGIETTSFQTGLRFAEMTFVVYFVSSSRYLPSSAPSISCSLPYTRDEDRKSATYQDEVRVRLARAVLCREIARLA